MSKKDELELLTCPGDTIIETLIMYSMTRLEFSEAIGLPLRKVDYLIKGRLLIDEQLADVLSRVLKIDKQFWINRERLYREKLDIINKM